jgi:hypothetical protein
MVFDWDPGAGVWITSRAGRLFATGQPGEKPRLFSDILG